MSLHVANMIIPLTFDVNTQNDAMFESRSAQLVINGVIKL